MYCCNGMKHALDNEYLVRRMKANPEPGGDLFLPPGIESPHRGRKDRKPILLLLLCPWCGAALDGATAHPE